MTFGGSMGGGPGLIASFSPLLASGDIEADLSLNLANQLTQRFCLCLITCGPPQPQHLRGFCLGIRTLVPPWQGKHFIHSAILIRSQGAC